MGKISKRINDQLNSPVDESKIEGLKPAMRVTPITCIIITGIGLFTKSPYIMWLSALTTLIGAFSKLSLYDRVYNAFTKKVKVPPLNISRSIGCGFGAIMLSTSGYMFFIGNFTLGFILGGFMILMASLAAIFQLCFVSLIINLFRKEKISCCN